MKSNHMHFSIFCSASKMEAEVVQMVNKIYGGNKESCGSTVYNMDDVAHCSMQVACACLVTYSTLLLLFLHHT